MIIKRFMFFVIGVTGILFAKDLTLTDTPVIMQRMFSYHVENKEFNPNIVRRMFKVYIEQFDPQKIYMTQSEVYPYLQMSNKQLAQIEKRLKQHDFSDFIQLNDLIKMAIERAQENRYDVGKELVFQEKIENPKTDYEDYALTIEDLKDRQKKRWESFFYFHKTKSRANNLLKKKKIVTLLENKLNRIEKPYLTQNEHDLALHILKAFCKSLDAHTAFFSDEEAYEMRMNLEKEFQGVGVVLTESIDGVVVSDMIQNSPAEKSKKIKVNDILVEIDGVSVVDMGFEDVLQRLKNHKSSVKLGFNRYLSSGDKTTFFRVKLKRKAISLEEERVTYEAKPYGEGIIGTLKLTSFYENNNGVTSEKDLKKAIKELKKQGPLYGVVLDLRENAGGFLTQAIKVASLFMSSGVVVISKYSNGEMRYLRNFDASPEFSGPLVVLTSKLSASASEIVAQALQDYGVALIVGDPTTYGKGSIQYQTVTNEEADYFFKVTVGKYYTVSGHTTQIKGVQADIVVPGPYSEYQIGERYLEYPLEADRVPAAYQDSLMDLDLRGQLWCEENYLPYLQRHVSFWSKMLPSLKKNSQRRLMSDRDFQNYLKKVKEKDLQNLPKQDFQMNEAIYILQDMIYLQSKKPLANAS
ncbi:MAG TPA: S41 family peptidase [Chlamydiales bacterium]|nr:S41 family peptidase [Chlamydiales bacterium]